MPLRLRAAALHLLASAAVAALAAALVFGLWYPGAYRHLAGGQSLFWLIVAVDVVLGPLLTLVVFNPKKPRRELVRDLTVIAALQLAALGYGLWTMFQARPVHLVFEVDRFRVVSAADIDAASLPKALPEFRSLPLTGPTVIGARRSASGEELLKSIEAASAGFDISMQPERWVAYDVQRAEALNAATPWPRFIERHAERRDVLEPAAREAAASAGIAVDRLRALPVQSRFATWTVLLDDRGEPRAFAPVDPF